MARTPASRKDKSSDESATDDEDKNNKGFTEWKDVQTNFAMRLSKIEPYKKFFCNPAVGEKSQGFTDYPIEYWCEPNKTMRQTIEHAQSSTIHKIDEVREKYASWAAKHNQTLDGSIPYNDEDSDDAPDDASKPDYNSQSEPEGRNYPNEAPPANVLKKFVIALVRFEPLHRWLLMTDYIDDITEADFFVKIECHPTCICPMNNSCIEWLKKNVPEITKYSMPKCDRKDKICSAHPQCFTEVPKHCNNLRRFCCYHNLSYEFLWHIVLSMKHKKLSKKTYRYSDEICHNERVSAIDDNDRIPRKGEQDDGSDNVHRSGRYRNRNRNRKNNPNWYVPNEQHASRNPNVNRNNDRNWNDFRRYQHNTFHARDRYNMNTRHKHCYDSHLTDGSRNEARGHINRFTNPPDVKEVDPYEKTSMSIQSSESSKKRKMNEEDIDLSGITDPSKGNNLGHLIPLLTEYSKNSQGNSLKISADDLTIEISASNNNNNQSQHQKGKKTISDAQRIRKNRQRKITRSKRRKAAALHKQSLEKQVLELKKQLAQSEKNDNRSSDDSHSEKDSMDVDSTKETKSITNSNTGSDDVDNDILNEQSENYVVDMNSTAHKDVQRLRPINEAESVVSSVTDNFSKVNNVKSLNERNQRHMNTSSLSSSSKSSSSNSECLYDVNDCWDACNQRNDHSVAVDSLIDKLNNTHIYRYDVLEGESLSLGMQSLKNMYAVEMTNPMVLAKWKFWNSIPCIMTRNYFHQPKPKNLPHNKILIIGIGYTKKLRNQWFSMEYPIKRAYVSSKPLIAATLPDLDKMLIKDLETNDQKPPSNVIKRDFLRALATEYMIRPCQVYTVNKLEDKFRAPHIISEYELNCNVNREYFIKCMTCEECNWKIDTIFFDNIRMIPSYVADNFGKGFFERLKDMVVQNILSDCSDGTNKGKIYLPFNNHIFYYVHACEMQEYYSIDYLEENDINVSNNTLHYATESNMLNDLFDAYGIETESSYLNHVTCTRKEILAYREDLEITQSDLKIILDELVSDIEQIRYIVLKKKSSTA